MMCRCIIGLLFWLLFNSFQHILFGVESVKVSHHFVQKNVILSSNQKKNKKQNTIILVANSKEIISKNTKSNKSTSQYGLISHLPDGVKNGLASGLASMLVKSILQPFDTIKTVQQANPMKLSLLNALLTTIEKKGVLGLWSGVGVTVLGSAPSSAAYFGVYSSTKLHISGLLKGQYGLATVAVSAAIANSFASFIRAPFEVIKQRIQMNVHKSTREAITYSFQKEGIFGLFGKGKLMSQIARDVPYAIVCLLTYEICQSAVKNYLSSHSATTTSTATVDSPSTSTKTMSTKTKSISKSTTKSTSSYSSSTTGFSHISNANILTVTKNISQFIDNSIYKFLSNRQLRDAFCGSVAGGLGSLLTTPMDVIKTRLMTDTKYGSVWVAMTMIAKQEGLGTLFRGALPRLMHKVPANALFFLFYEAFRSLLGVSMTKS